MTSRLPACTTSKIEYPDGRVGAVEVTAAEDQNLAARQGALAGRRALLQDDRLAHGWLVVLRDSAQVNVARERLPRLLLRLEAVGLQEARVSLAPVASTKTTNMPGCRSNWPGLRRRPQRPLVVPPARSS